MKNPFLHIQNKTIRINKRILLLLGIIFIVSPGWLFGLYWMKNQRLPWERQKTEESSEDSAKKDIDEIPLGEERSYTNEEIKQVAAELEGYPVSDENEEAKEANAFYKVKDYQFYGDIIVIKDKRLMVTSNTLMIDDGKLSAEKGIKNLYNKKKIVAIYFQIEGGYITLIEF